MKLIWSLLLLIPIFSFSQSGSCDFPKAKAKVVRANNVTQDGKSINKGDYITVDKSIPNGKYTSTFFECNQLAFEKNGELIFRYDGELVNKQINYHQFMQQENPSNTNLSSRGGFTDGNEFDCTKKFSHPELFSLLQREKTISDRACLERYFSKNYWLTDKDVLILESPFLDSLILSSEEDEFMIHPKDGILEIDSDKLPENGHFDIYMLKNGEAELVAEEVYLINIKKTVDNLKAAGFSEDEIRAYIRQNLLFFDVDQLTEIQKIKLEKSLSELFN